MVVNKRVKAGALQFVLFIGALIAILLSTFVLLHHVHHKFDKKTEKTITLVKKADWGIHHALSQNFPLND
ncbi:hypothetical protein GTQ34_16535, partial [Muricauda sp. JGD-17]|nr:hypothetical protein [Allomuricauda ochracea]NAY93516.1 hypothetical protein [Allomuricauda ochracea]